MIVSTWIGSFPTLLAVSSTQCHQLYLAPVSDLALRLRAASSSKLDRLLTSKKRRLSIHLSCAMCSRATASFCKLGFAESSICAVDAP